MNEEIKSWDYRLVRRYYEHSSYLSLTEVYYNNKEQPVSFVIDPNLPTWEEDDQLEDSKKECAAEFAKMMLAWELPILDELKDFPQISS